MQLIREKYSKNNNNKNDGNHNQYLSDRRYFIDCWYIYASVSCGRFNALCPRRHKIYYIDPKPAMNSRANLTVIAEPATVGVKKAIELISV